MTSTPRPVTILVAALGGQGGGVLAEWLVEAATQAGYLAQSTSIPGVAQRTGATTYYVEIHPVPAAMLGARRPVLSLLPVPGGVDLLVASEMLEAARMAGAGLPSPERTTVIASTSRTLTTAEKMALGDGRFAPDRLLQALREQSRHLVAFDMETVARESGTVVSAVMFGAIAGSGLLPFGREACEAVIGETGVGVEGSLRGFAAGAGAVRTAQSPAAPPSTPFEEQRVPDASATAAQAFPAPARRMIALGHARVAEYQDARYASLYLERLHEIAAAEAKADPRGGHGHALLRETARHLALWMAFDDIVRVASLKTRSSRFDRVRREAAAADGDVVTIVDFFKPGMPEIAGLLPPGIARRLLAWDARRQARGNRPFGVALHLRTDGVVGFAALRTLAALRGLRPRSARFREEQQAIRQWLDAIVGGANESWQVAWETAQCGRLVKGYGATNERGKRNLAHILRYVVLGSTLADPDERARAIAAAREAALADEGGMALDKALAARGIAPRPPVTRPIQWVKRGRPPREAA